MFCTECGHRWAPDEIATARFCAECGAPREDLPPPPAAVSASPAPPAPPAPLSHAHSFSASSSSGSFSSGGPLSALTPTPVAPTFAPPAAVVCTSCTEPFANPDAAFCGECGYPRPATASTADDGDLFGSASTAYAPPPSASYAAAAYPAPANDLSGSSFGAPTASIGFDPPHATHLAPPPVATSFQNYAMQPSPSYVPYAEPNTALAHGADPSSPPASLEFNAVPSSVNNISSLLSSLSGELHGS